MDTIIDKVGNEIQVGSFLAYGHALGHAGAIRIGKVIKTKIVEVLHYDKRVEITYRITVRGIDDDWKSHQPALTPKLATLYFPDRMIVLLPDQVPTAYRDLLDAKSSS